MGSLTIFYVIKIFILLQFNKFINCKNLFFYSESIIASISCDNFKLIAIDGGILSDQNFKSCSNENDTQLTSYYRNAFYQYSSTNSILASISSNEESDFALNLLANQSSASGSEQITDVALTDSFVYHIFKAQKVLIEARSLGLSLMEKLKISGVLEYKTIGSFFDYPFLYLVISKKVQSSGITKHQSSLIR